MIIKHPTIAGVSREVPDDQVGDWIAMGWVKQPDESAPEPVAEEQGNQEKAVRPGRKGSNAE